MRHRAGIFRKLVSAQFTHILNALYRPRMQIRGKFLITENRQPLFQRQLKPIAARHPIARPVMEILMPDHRFNRNVIAIGGGFRAGEYQLGVEHVQPFVFHRPHIEVVDRYHHVNIKVVFQPETLFIPLHRTL